MSDLGTFRKPQAAIAGTFPAHHLAILVVVMFGIMTAAIGTFNTFEAHRALVNQEQTYGKR